MLGQQVSSSVQVGGEASRAAMHFFQLFRAAQPNDFPASIVSGLFSTVPSVQQTAIAELREYMESLFFLRCENYFQITNLVTAGIICLLIIIGVPVVLHRFYHGRLHVFRLERRMQGIYIVPNAINCFLLLEGIYGILTVTYNFCVWKMLHYHTVLCLKLFQPFRSLIWIPLYLGAFLTGWGSFYTAPGALDKPTASRHKTSAKGHLPWPMIVNLSCLGTPILLIISLLAPVSLSSVKMVDAFNQYRTWDRSLQKLLEASGAGNLVSQAAVNELRTQAYSIVTVWTTSYYYSDIGYAMWAVWALLFLVFYVPAGGVLVYLLYRQVKRQKVILLSYQRKLAAQLAQEERQAQISVLTGEKAAHHPAHLAAGRKAERELKGTWGVSDHPSRLGAPLEDIYEDRGISDDGEGTGHSGATVSFKGSQELVGIETALRQELPAWYPSCGSHTPSNDSHLGQVASLAEEGQHTSAAKHQRSGSAPVSSTIFKAPLAFRKLMCMETSTIGSRSGATSQASRKPKRILITGGPMSRYRYLRRCLVNLLILYLGIISAACTFGAITIYLAAVEYGHALQGPAAVANSIAIAGSIAAWVSAVFGTLTIGSLIFRNFDNPQPESSQNSGDGGGGMRRRFHRYGSRTVDSCCAGLEQTAAGRGPAGHDKSRTLPAVPESVNLEASMMSMIRSQPRMAMNTSMKFAMAEQTSRPGGFVIRPDDQLASAFSVGNTPEMEETSRSGYYGSAGRVSKSKSQPVLPLPASRPWLSRKREATMSVPQDVTESFGLTSLPMIAIDSEIRRSRQGSIERGSSEDPIQPPETNDTTLAEYLSFDPRVLKGAPEAASTMNTAAERRQDTKLEEVSAVSPVLKLHPRLSGYISDESPASKIAREWAQSQYLTTPLPETPTIDGGRDLEAHTSGSGTGGQDWIGNLEASPLSSPMPSRSARYMRRPWSPDAQF